MVNVQTIIVDDDPILNLLMIKIMERVQFYPSPAEFNEPLKAIDFLKEKYNQKDFFVLFLDLYMPDLDGLGFLKALADFAKPHNFFVYVVSSTTDSSEIDAVMNSAFVREFLPKPIFADTLNLIKDFIEKELKLIANSQ